MATEAKNTAKDAIKIYLDGRAATDELFAVSYAKEGKNLDECWRYIINQAKKRGSAVCMTDEEVFGLAVHYYDEDDIDAKELKFTPVRAGQSDPAKATTVKLTEKEKAEAREAARLAYERQCLKEEAEKAAKRKKAEAERKAEQRKKIEEQAAPSLFDDF